MDQENHRKVLIVLRGLPWTGKSFRAKELLEEYQAKGEHGVIHSTDEYFYTVLKPEKLTEYSWNPRFLGDAHRWNRVRTQSAIEQGVTPIIIDNTNSTAQEPREYVWYAANQDYEIQIEEPTSERWKEIRNLLLNKRKNKQELKDWAKKLEAGSKETHNVPFFAIERMMWRWENDLTVQQILDSPKWGE